MTATPSQLEPDLLTTQRPALLRLFRQFGASTADAEDLAQETCLRALRHQASLRHPERANAWLQTIARRTYADFCARRTTPPLHNPTPPQPSPEALLQQHQQAQALHLAIADLPDGQQRAIEDFYLNERSYPEIEAQTGASRASLAARLFKGRRNLAERLRLGLLVPTGSASPAAFIVLLLASPVLVMLLPPVAARVLTSQRLTARGGWLVVALAHLILTASLLADWSAQPWLAALAPGLMLMTGMFILAEALLRPHTGLTHAPRQALAQAAALIATSHAALWWVAQDMAPYTLWLIAIHIPLYLIARGADIGMNPHRPTRAGLLLALGALLLVVAWSAPVLMVQGWLPSFGYYGVGAGGVLIALAMAHHSVETDATPHHSLRLTALGFAVALGFSLTI